MVKTLYLTRHGQTLFNQLGKIQGACDSPLTELGIEQGKKVREYFEQEGIEFDIAVSSTQERAIDTLKLITDAPSMQLKGIKEWHFGEFEGESERLNPRLDGEGYSTQFVPYGGESDVEVTERTVTTLTKVMEEAPEDGVVLAVSHGGACLRFIMSFYDVWHNEYPYFSNCAIQKIEYKNGQFNIVKSIDPINKEEKEIF